MIECPAFCGENTLRSEAELKEHLTSKCKEKDKITDILKSPDIQIEKLEEKEEFKDNEIFEGLDEMVQKYCNENIQIKFFEL